MKAQRIVLWGPEERDSLHRVIDGLKTGKRPWLCIIKPFYESPTDRQRGYYRTAVLQTLSEYTGYTVEQMHEWLKKKFGESACVEINGEAHDVVTFSTGNRGELEVMRAYIDAIIIWAASELGVYIPPPKDKHERAVA